MFYIVPTPIGNLEDITLRAIRILKEADLVAAEDTRHTKILLNHFEIKTPMESFHSYSGTGKLEKIVDLLKGGKNIALVSDAGTPGISDPGFLLIKRAIEENIPFTVLPGASALLVALVSSGFRMDKFTYLGFLPLKRKRRKIIESLKKAKRTVIFYESPHRLMKTLSQFAEILGDGRVIAVCRELTKMYEEVFRGTLRSAIEHFEKNKPRGEFTLVLKEVSKKDSQK